MMGLPPNSLLAVDDDTANTRGGTIPNNMDLMRIFFYHRVIDEKGQIRPLVGQFARVHGRAIFVVVHVHEDVADLGRRCRCGCTRTVFLLA